MAAKTGKEMLQVVEINFRKGVVKLDPNKVSIAKRLELNNILGRIRAKSSAFAAMVDFEINVGETVESWEKRAAEADVDLNEAWILRREKETPMEHITRLNLPKSDDVDFAFHMINDFHKYLEGDNAYQVAWEDFEQLSISDIFPQLHRFASSQRLHIPEVAPVNSKSA